MSRPLGRFDIHSVEGIYSVSSSSRATTTVPLYHAQRRKTPSRPIFNTGTCSNRVPMNIAIIGAGAAGLAAAKNLGTATPSPCLRRYRASLVFGRLTRARHANRSTRNSGRTLPIDLMAFWDFSFDANDKPASTRDFPEAEAVRAYLARYAITLTLHHLFNSIDELFRREGVAMVGKCYSTPTKSPASMRWWFAITISLFSGSTGPRRLPWPATHSANFVRGADHPQRNRRHLGWTRIRYRSG